MDAARIAATFDTRCRTPPLRITLDENAMPDEQSPDGEPKTTFIYALTDPRPGDLHVYIGKADNPKKRYAQHSNKAHSDKTYKAAWLRSLVKNGLKPGLQIVAEVPALEWENWETTFIRWYRALGWKVVNTTDGGDGISNPTAAVRAKLRSAKIGKRLCQEHRDNIGAAQTGKKRSAEARANIGAGKVGEKNPMFGKAVSAETRSKISAAGKGRVFSPDSLDKIRAAKLGARNPMFGRRYSQSEERRSRISAAKMGHTVSKETRNKIRETLLRRSKTVKALNQGSSHATHITLPGLGLE
jgi:hypothetical protein